MRYIRLAFVAILAAPLCAGADAPAPPTTAAGKKTSQATTKGTTPSATVSQTPAATSAPSALLRPAARITTTTGKARVSTTTTTTAPALDTSLLTRDDAAGATPLKEWKSWDDGAADRVKSSRFRLASSLRGGTLSLADTRIIMAQERAIAQLSDDLKGDDKLDANEREQIRALLKKANELVFSGRNDSSALNAALLKRLDGGEMSVAEAKDLCSEIKRLFELYRTLASNQPITSAQRADLGAEYNQLVAILHE